MAKRKRGQKIHPIERERLRLEVFQLWLEGYSCCHIARVTGMNRKTASRLVHECQRIYLEEKGIDVTQLIDLSIARHRLSMAKASRWLNRMEQLAEDDRQAEAALREELQTQGKLLTWPTRYTELMRHLPPDAAALIRVITRAQTRIEKLSGVEKRHATMVDMAAFEELVRAKFQITVTEPDPDLALAFADGREGANGACIAKA